MRPFAPRCQPLLLLLLLLALAAPARAQSPPNVVVLMTDDQTQASLPYMPQTAQLLSDEGTVFDQAIASFPLCCPSRATHLTGQYAHNHGVLHNSGPFGGFKRLQHLETLPVWLQRAGYRTMHVGRYLNGYEYADGVPAGWEDWHGSPHSGAFNYTRWRVNENGSLVTYPQPSRPDEYLTDYQARRATDLIDRAAPSERPFFLQLWFVAPHRGGPGDPDDPRTLGTPSPAPRHRDALAGAPMPRPPSFDEANMFDKPQVVGDRPRLTPERAAAIEENWRQELESLQAVDDAVARIVGALERSGELANTLIVYTSDNGFMHGEHRAQGEKVLLYEESIRVPLILRGPGIPRRWRDPRPVANVDVVPTILDATGASPGRPLDGRSLLEMEEDRGVWLGRDLLIENGNGANNVPAYRALRTNGFLYAEHRTTGEFELYDLERDPYQLQSRHSDPGYTGVRQRLAARLAALRSCAGSSCRTRPALRRKLKFKKGPNRCAKTPVKLRIKGDDVDQVDRIEVFRKGKRIDGDGRRPFRERLSKKELGGRGKVVVRVRAELFDGRRIGWEKKLKVCG